MTNYYYLVASLPELDLENVNKKFDWEEVYENIRVNIDSEDYMYLKQLLYRNDIKNLVNVIAENHQYPFPHTKFSSPSTLGKELIKEYLGYTDQLPYFIQHVLEEYGDKFQSMNPLQIENLFLQSYYKYVVKSTNVFIAHFSAFDLHLKNIITAVNCRKNKKSIEENLLGDLETTPVLVKSSAKDFGLAEKFEYINQVIELIENEHIWKLNQYVDSLRWSYCDELTSVSFFKIDNLLAYILKLMMLSRRIDLNDEAGMERLNHLTGNALQQLEIPVG